MIMEEASMDNMRGTVCKKAPSSLGVWTSWVPLPFAKATGLRAVSARPETSNLPYNARALRATRSQSVLCGSIWNL